MQLVVFLMDGLLASRTLLVVLAILAFTDQVGCVSADLTGLSALLADHQHGAGVEEMHVPVILFNEPLIDLIAVLTSDICLPRIGSFRRYLDELVTLRLELPFVDILVGLVCLDRSFIMVQICFLSVLLQLVLDCF